MKKECIRCSNPAERNLGSKVPFARLYCAPCLKVREQQRAAADVVQGAIVEVRHGDAKKH